MLKSFCYFFLILLFELIKILEKVSFCIINMKRINDGFYNYNNFVKFLVDLYFNIYCDLM